MEFTDQKAAVLALLVLYLLFFNNVDSASDSYLLDCGSLANTSVGNRVFVADKYAANYLSTPQDIAGNTSNSITTASTNATLYQTARVFTATSKFTFPINQKGRHFIRLYFFPFVYKTYNMTQAKFSVSAQQFELLSGFTPSNSATVKEYSVNVTSDSLVVTFTPSSSSFAFLNGLEVVSVPDSLISDDANLVNLGGSYKGITGQALETVARVNMGGPIVNYSNDTLWRTWVPDDEYLANENLVVNVSKPTAVRYLEDLATPDTAPTSVYSTAKRMNSQDNPSYNVNMTWVFDVDTGFQYLVRFHYCDIVSTSPNNMYFNVFINSWYVFKDFDLTARADNGLGHPVFVDAVTLSVTSSKLSVSIGPSTTALYPDGILNGLEIMKLTTSKGSLSSSKKSKVGLIIGIALGAAFLLFILCCILFIFCRRRCKKQSKNWLPQGDPSGCFSTTGTTFSSAISNLGYRIPFAAVQEATNSFDESLVIGIGGFGKVYKGVLSDGTKVAVKRGNPRSQQGLAEFRTEIEMLSQFRHRHLVSLIGYCDERNEMILIYEPVIDPTLPREKVNLAEWAMKWHKMGQLDQIIDPSLVGDVKPESLRKFGETAEKCLADFGVDRPAMGDVLWNLEYALQLQEAVVPDDPDDNSTNMIGELPPQINNLNQRDDDAEESTLVVEESDVGDLSGVSMSRVFSQLGKLLDPNWPICVNVEGQFWKRRAAAGVIKAIRDDPTKLSIKHAILSARKKDRIKLPRYKDGYHISDFLNHTSGIEAMLNVDAMEKYEALDSNTYRCRIPAIHFLNFDVAPVLDLVVNPTTEDCTVEMLSCKFEGSDIMERQNEQFSASMKNHITWKKHESESFLYADVKLSIKLKIQSKPFNMLPVSAVERPGNIMMGALLDRFVPLLLQQMLRDYDDWVKLQSGHSP
ncbi:hypothetical protein V2J09_005168 [Rumex salicifolius]